MSFCNVHLNYVQLPESNPCCWLQFPGKTGHLGYPRNMLKPTASFQVTVGAPLNGTPVPRSHRGLSVADPLGIESKTTGGRLEEIGSAGDLVQWPFRLMSDTIGYQLFGLESQCEARPPSRCIHPYFGVS